MKIDIQAAPGAVALDTETAAVLVIDMQNDFGARGGMFDRAGIDVALIRAAIQPTARAIAAARRAGIAIVYLKMGYRPDLSDLGALGSPNRERHLAFSVGSEVAAPDGHRSRVLIRDTWNTEIVDELKPQPGDLVIWKTRFSGFYETELDATLRSRGITQLIVTGGTTSICVESTMRDAMFRDYSCVLLADCSAEPIGAELTRTNHDASLRVIQALLGWVSSSTELIRALEAKAGWPSPAPDPMPRSNRAPWPPSAVDRRPGRPPSSPRRQGRSVSRAVRSSTARSVARVFRRTTRADRRRRARPFAPSRTHRSMGGLRPRALPGPERCESRRPLRWRYATLRWHPRRGAGRRSRCSGRAAAHRRSVSPRTPSNRVIWSPCP